VKSPIDWNGQKKINLALQGGGAHGAFTWGVLDHILEDGRLDVEAISGASAGAMNAVVYAQGYLENGRDGARKRLASFWKAVSDEGSLAGSHNAALDAMFKPFGFDKSPAYWWLDTLTHYSSPYDFNPLNLNPLRDLVARVVDFDKVRACEHIRLFISATNVHTGKIAVFERDKLTVDHVMASACLPLVFQAVEIDGTPYWDGGYMGNPALFPLFYDTACADTLIVQINPIERDDTPKSAQDIQNRLNEITFNAALLRELRAVEFVQRLVDQKKLGPPDYIRPIMHRIDGASPMSKFSAASKMDASWDSLVAMRDIGRAAAKAWLAAHFDDVGVRDTFDLRASFS
jgi:NTE family protein